MAGPFGQNKPLVAIRAFDHASVVGYLKPDPRMTKRTFTTVARYARLRHSFGFWGFDAHQLLLGILLSFNRIRDELPSGKIIWPVGSLKKDTMAGHTQCQ